MSPSRVRTFLATLACVAAAMAVPAAGASGCAGVVTHGPWSVVQPPSGIGPLNLAVAFGRGGRDTMYGFADHGRALLRGTDGGCRWDTAVSLDALGTATDPMRLDASYELAAVGIGQAAGSAPYSVWVVAADNQNGLAVSLPVVTIVSLDGGAHWTVHQASTKDLEGDYPRCARDGAGFTSVRVGTDRSTAYLRCRISGFAESFVVAQCVDAYYVTHDAGATWTTVHSRLADPQHGDVHDLTGCGRAYQQPRPSTVLPHVVWDVGNGPAGTGVLAISRDDGATFVDYATTAKAINGLCGFAVGDTSSRRPRPPAAMWDGNDVYTSTGAATLATAPRPRPRVGKLDRVTGAAMVTDASGAASLFVAYTTLQPVGAVAFTFDLTRRRWRQLDPPPKRVDLTPAWTGYDSVRTISTPGVQTVYLALPGLIFRYAGR